MVLVGVDDSSFEMDLHHKELYLRVIDYQVLSLNSPIYSDELLQWLFSSDSLIRISMHY